MCLVITRYILEGKQAKREERKQAVLLYCLHLGSLADLISLPHGHIAQDNNYQDIMLNEEIT
jgi:hypothetical protein